MKKFYIFIVLISFCGLNEAIGQWTTNGNNIYNTNSGNVGIGNNSPATLLYVGKSITEPTITVRNMGGSGGATYVMMDDASGANWKFKATLSGGFKIRDHANLMDVFVIEPNSAANALYINSAGNVGVGTATPTQTLTVNGTFTYAITQNNVTSLRVLNSVYQNTTGRIMHVSIVSQHTAAGTTHVYCDSFSPPTTLVSAMSQSNNYARNNFFIVPPNYFYKVYMDSGGTIIAWIEWY